MESPRRQECWNRHARGRGVACPLIVACALLAAAPGVAQLAEVPHRACELGRCAELNLPALSDGTVVRLSGTLTCTDGECDPDPAPVQLALLRTVDVNGNVGYFDVQIKSFDNSLTPGYVGFGAEFDVNLVGADFGGFVGSGSLYLTTVERGKVSASALVVPPPGQAPDLLAFDAYVTKLADPRPSPVFIFLQ